MVFGQMQWSRVRNTGNLRHMKCCAISWSNQRYKKRKGREGKTLRLAEPKADEETLNIEIVLKEINEEMRNDVVFTENSNYSSQYSLKLKAHSTYSIQLVMESNLTLKYFKMKDNRFKLEENGSEDAPDGRKVYKFIWSTNDVPKTKNRKRFIVASAVSIEGYKTFRYDILAKFYRQEERQVYDGIELSSIGLEFIVPKDIEAASYDNEGEDSDDEDETASKFHLINNMTFNAIDDDE